MRSVHLSRSFRFYSNFLSAALDHNHRMVRNLAVRRGKNFMFIEVFGIGYLLSIVAYGSYLITTGGLAAENILLSFFAIYAALGIRGINSGYSELKEKIGVINSVESFFGTELASGREERIAN